MGAWVVAYLDDEPVGCGGVKRLDDTLRGAQAHLPGAGRARARSGAPPPGAPRAARVRARLRASAARHGQSAARGARTLPLRGLRADSPTTTATPGPPTGWRSGSRGPEPQSSANDAVTISPAGSTRQPDRRRISASPAAPGWPFKGAGSSSRPAIGTPPRRTRCIRPGRTSTRGSARGSPSTTMRSAAAPGARRPRSLRPERGGATGCCGAQGGKRAKAALGHAHEFPRLRAGRARVEPHGQRDARRVGRLQGEVGLLELSLRLVDEARDPLVCEALGEIVERREGGHEDLAARGHALEQRGLAMRARGRARSCRLPPRSRGGRRASPSACAATRRPRRWASSTSAASSSRVSWAARDLRARRSARLSP